MTIAHRCLACRKIPECLPQRADEGHVAVRFGDMAKFRVFTRTEVEGEDDPWEEIKTAIEARAFRDGNGWMYVACETGGRWHQCHECLDELCVQLATLIPVRIESVRDEVKA